jgi:hypothetical protein
VDNPFLFKAVNVPLSKQAVVGQSLSLCASHPGSKHQEWSENGQDEKGYKTAHL